MIKYKIVFAPSFGRKYSILKKRYVFLSADLAVLLAELQVAPQSGSPLGQSCYKVRMRIKAKQTGKSGGARVITCIKLVQDTIYLLTIYDKSEQETITDEERDNLLRENNLL